MRTDFVMFEKMYRMFLSKRSPIFFSLALLFGWGGFSDGGGRHLACHSPLETSGFFSNRAEGKESLFFRDAGEMEGGEGPLARRISDSSLQKRLERHIAYDKSGENLVGYLDIGNSRAIDESTYIYVKFALEHYKRRGVRLVVLRLNTPGGEVLSSMKIADLLQRCDVQEKIPVVALIDDWAVSAGAMLAYACRFIFITPNAIMGAAEPVFVGRNGEGESASEKVNSALRAEFANRANFYGRDPLIAQAMVDKDEILVIRNREVVPLDREDEAITSGESPDLFLTKRGKLLTLRAEQLIDLGVADFLVSPTDFQKGDERGEQVASVLQAPYLEGMPHVRAIGYSDWRVDFFALLSHPLVASLLLMGLVVGCYLEINTPGFGLFGSIALGCFALLLLSSIASQAIHWIEVILLIAGLVLLSLEFFVIPGFGIAGILGILLTLAGLFALGLPKVSSLHSSTPYPLPLIILPIVKRMGYLCGALLLSAILILLLVKFSSRRFLSCSPLVLRGEQEAEQGYVSGMSLEELPKEGDAGKTMTPLRPSGKIRIGERMFDAMSEGGYLHADLPIRVLRIDGNQIIVRPREGARKE